MIFLCDVCTRFEILHIGSHLHNFIQDCAILKYCINLNFCKNPWGKLYVYYIKTNICKKGIMGNMNCQLKRNNITSSTTFKERQGTLLSDNAFNNASTNHNLFTTFMSCGQ